MQINSIGLYSNRSSYYGNKNRISHKNNRNIYSQAQLGNVQHSGYPRRYLPTYYPNISTNQTYDSFTKLRDKNYLLNVIKQLMSECEKTGKEFSIGVFDMDNFKSVNELLGYKTGDDFIIEISNTISNVAKKNSLHAYRFGGEEFVIVFDNNQSQKEKNNISQDIISSIMLNPFIKSKKDEYLKNAYQKLDEYTIRSSQVGDLIPLKAKRDLLRDLQFNFETKEASNDAYLQHCIKDVNFKIKKLYLNLINTRIQEEESLDVVKRLRVARNKIGANILLDKSDENLLDEYLLSIYDKTFEIHQLKKWIKDFTENDGFSITGGVVDFKRETIAGKTPNDIVNEAGEVLKQGKIIHKGRKYFAN